MPEHAPDQWSTRPGHDEQPESEPETAHGRVGYGRYGKYTPLALALLMVLGLAAIGWLQWRAPAAEPAIRPGQLPGTAAPDASLTLLDGTSLTLSDLLGSVVVLNFWASWCEPCRAEMPVLQAVHDEAVVTGEATAVLGVGIRTDHDADARALVHQLGLTYPIGRDTDTDAPGIGPIEHAFGIQGAYPSTIIIRPDGAVDRLLLGEVTADQVRFAIDEARANAGPVASGSESSDGKELVAGYR
ncbi:MAG: TlpA family protein disulfide reductase [Chloroflexia bacterium]|nr:TlpA family protein disulfide reductase [Chloroflexia bacterium]